MVTSTSPLFELHCCGNLLDTCVPCVCNGAEHPSPPSKGWPADLPTRALHPTHFCITCHASTFHLCLLSACPIECSSVSLLPGPHSAQVGTYSISVPEGDSRARCHVTCRCDPEPYRDELTHSQNNSVLSWISDYSVIYKIKKKYKLTGAFVVA